MVRETDAVGRLGGDEFVVIASELSFASGPELIAERLLEALDQPFKLAGAGPHGAEADREHRHRRRRQGIA